MNPETSNDWLLLYVVTGVILFLLLMEHFFGHHNILVSSLFTDRPPVSLKLISTHVLR